MANELGGKSSECQGWVLGDLVMFWRETLVGGADLEVSLWIACKFGD
ncbi:hypothetical protein [Bremerella alba]|nr:hypothetical protein [Bremerella alba]